MRPYSIHLIVGARPNFMKIAPLYDEFAARKNLFNPSIIHTGQHYDEKMSKLFFKDLGMPEPSAYLQVGSGPHGLQTARILERYEEYILSGAKPDLVVVAGDVNSTIACALVAKKLHIPVAHLEAGLRSFDEKMPEEINRVLTDRISDLLLIPSPDANENLLKEGVPEDKIHFVGNIMIDSLVKHLEKARESSVLDELKLGSSEDYCLITLHRPSNVDDPQGLSIILKAFARIGQTKKLVFPMHPRTRKNIENLGLLTLLDSIPNLIITDPIGYLDFLKLEMEAGLILTDSGGIQEESTYLGIPCLTLRENTERPITIQEGTNRLVKLDTDSIVEAVKRADIRKLQPRKIPLLWDGKTAQRVVTVVEKWLKE